MKIAVYFLLIIASILLSCSNDDKPEKEGSDEHELLYMSTSDSLKKYRDIEIFDLYKAHVTGDSIVTDYIDLSYTSFKKKYSMTSSQMDILSQSLNVSMDIAKAFLAIEENTKKANILSIDRQNRIDSTSYSFQKYKYHGAENSSTDDSVLFEIMMSAYDAEIDSL